jgi:cold shock protein
MTDQAPQRISGATGLVKWFDRRKGFGFIISPEGCDVFAHFSVIEGPGFRKLEDGQKVTYDAEQTDKGWKATCVRLSAEVTTTPAARGVSRSPRR